MKIVVDKINVNSVCDVAFGLSFTFLEARNKVEYRENKMFLITTLFPLTVRSRIVKR